MRRPGLVRWPSLAGLIVAMALGGPALAQCPGGYVDGHTHLMVTEVLGGGQVEPNIGGASEAALGVMERLGMGALVVMPPPFTMGQDDRFDAEELALAAGAHPGRLYFLAGGGSLNPMIQQAVAEGGVSEKMRRRFAARAKQIVALGARGFGEMAAEHLSFRPQHPYMAAPPDHPLFLLLADLAAANGLPIDLHMEAVAQDMPLPEGLGSTNPPQLRANLAAFERLLEHNRQARIIWAHAGWDNTGARDVALCRRLLESHPNLYMSLKLDKRRGLPVNKPLDRQGGLKPEWLELVRAHPDRFILGSDHFFLAGGDQRQLPRRGPAMRKLLGLLPPGLARQVGCDNPRRLFGLGD
ncbi:MAG: amidohydrolase [Proteobacteria bacterium]|nr:amidohydrolase [Pseudomonadota bacterium]MBU1451440.1 amidohydrolase [Pseudomonadota bacterium]MBU2469052.1 amidohydrolase [Pseudomonadota bacterium]MBU2519569.1 amidohydrolase [Pseudomonadota bacterium]